MKTRLLLLAEDEATSRLLLSRMLQELGFEVLEAKDGLQALAYLKDRRDEISAVFTDAHLPGLEGFELFAIMQASKDLQFIPAILVSADDGLRSFARSKGFCGWIHKPIQLADLRHLLTLIGLL